MDAARVAQTTRRESPRPTSWRIWSEESRYVNRRPASATRRPDRSRLGHTGALSVVWKRTETDGGRSIVPGPSSSRMATYAKAQTRGGFGVSMPRYLSGVPRPGGSGDGDPEARSAKPALGSCRSRLLHGRPTKSDQVKHVNRSMSSFEIDRVLQCKSVSYMVSNNRMKRLSVNPK